MQDQRVQGLDTLRFYLAALVAVFHTGLPPVLEGSDQYSYFCKLLKWAWACSLNGQAAVIVFFVISGFCIHYPFRNGARPQLSKFYPRRYLRILVPVLIWVSISYYLGVEMPLFDCVLWSLVCEEIYYLIYPSLLRLRDRFGWNNILIAAFILGACVAWTKPIENRGYPSIYGWKLNWLQGLPCWLLGCKLAELCDGLLQPVARGTIWKWRFGMLALGYVCQVLDRHTDVGNNHTLNYLAIAAFFWLQMEIRYYRHNPAPRWSESAGKWSYSLYLTHTTTGIVFAYCHFTNFGFFLNWVARLVWVLGIAYAFYLIVEKPSHILARWLGSGKQPGTPAGNQIVAEGKTVDLPLAA